MRYETVHKSDHFFERRESGNVFVADFSVTSTYGTFNFVFFLEDLLELDGGFGEAGRLYDETCSAGIYAPGAVRKSHS